MKKNFILSLFVISSCSNKDEGNIEITLDIEKGIIGQWNVEWE